MVGWVRARPECGGWVLGAQLCVPDAIGQAHVLRPFDSNLGILATYSYEGTASLH